MRKLILVALAALLSTHALGQGDTTPPTVTDITADGTYLPGATLGPAPSQIVVTFSEDIDAATVSADTFRLVRSGGDGTFGDGNEVVIVPDSVTLTSPSVAEMDLTTATLADDAYQVLVRHRVDYRPWGTPVNVPVLNTTAEEWMGTLSADGLEIFFGSYRGGGPGNGDIYAATRPDTSSPWSAPVCVTELSSSAWEGHSALSADGLQIWINSTRGGGSGYTDIWTATRAGRSSPWSALVNVVELNSGEYDGDPVLSSDGLTMWVSRGPSGGANIYVSTRPTTSDPWSAPTLVAELNVAGQEFPTHISEDGLTLWYHKSAIGSGDVWRATRPDASSPWDTFVSVSEVNSSARDLASWVSGDMEEMYLYSGRSGGVGNLDIWGATRSLKGITDLAGNVLDGEFSGSFPSGDGTAGGDLVCFFTVNTDGPDVVSILRTGASPTTGTSVGYTVTFDEGVSGVDAADFAVTFLLGSCTHDAPVVTLVGASTYTVTVGNISGEGTLRLDLIDDGSITDVSGVGLGGDYTSGDTYDVDNVAPAKPGVVGPAQTQDSTPTWMWWTGGGGDGLFRYGFEDSNWLVEDVGATEFTPPVALPDGAYTLYVQERDVAGNWSVSGSFTITITAAPPDDPETPFDGGCAADSHGSPFAWLLPLALLALALTRSRCLARCEATAHG